MIMRSFESDTISFINDLRLFSNDKLFVLVVCSDDISIFSTFFYDVIVEPMNIHEKK